jgi:hypothetical protein
MAHVNGDEMFSFLLANTSGRSDDNEREFQQTHNFAMNQSHEEDMNFTFISTLRATGATTAIVTTDNFSLSTATEPFLNVKLRFGNVSKELLSKVRFYIICILKIVYMKPGLIFFIF